MINLDFLAKTLHVIIEVNILFEVSQDGDCLRADCLQQMVSLIKNVL